jgi:hypothetical protein
VQNDMLALQIPSYFFVFSELNSVCNMILTPMGFYFHAASAGGDIIHSQAPNDSPPPQ